jgi:hypothetical protein
MALKGSYLGKAVHDLAFFLFFSRKRKEAFVYHFIEQREVLLQSS